MITQKDALEFIVNNKRGEINDLTPQIGEEYTKDFELIGYIIRGNDSFGKDTWRVSESANDTWEKLYSPLTLYEKVTGLFLGGFIKA